MKLHVLFHWVLFRKQKENLSLQGTVGARTQVLPLTKRENITPATAESQLVNFFLPLSLIFTATELRLSYCPSLRGSDITHSNTKRGHIRNPRWKFFLLKREFPVVLPGYSCTFNLYFDLLPNSSSDTTGSSEHPHSAWQSQGAFQLQCQHSSTGTSAGQFLLWRVFFGCKLLSILPKCILLKLGNAHFQL